MQSSDFQDVEPVYTKWVENMFGPSLHETGLQDLVVHDAESFLQFFTQLYVSQHPEMGIVQPQIEFSDLFD